MPFSALVHIDAPGVVFGEKNRGFTVASKPAREGEVGLTGIRAAAAAASVRIQGNVIAMNEVCGSIRKPLTNTCTPAALTELGMTIVASTSRTRFFGPTRRAIRTICFDTTSS